MISQSLRSQVTGYTDTIGQLRAELEEKSNAVLTLQSQHQSVANELDEKTNGIAALQSVLTQRDEENRRLVDQLNSKATLVVDLRLALLTVEDSMKSLETKLLGKSQALSSVKEYCSGLEQELSLEQVSPTFYVVVY